MGKLNRAEKKMSALDAWENSKKASVEAKLKEIEVPYMHPVLTSSFYYLQTTRKHEKAVLQTSRKSWKRRRPSMEKRRRTW